MDTTIIQNWNKVVGVNDTVYHLGDVGWWNDKYQYMIENQLKQLNGHIHLILGNHDKKLFRGKMGKKLRERFSSIQDYLLIKVNDEEMELKQKIILFHYPIEDWDGKFHGSFHLHGHCHSSVKPNHPCRVDVGVDCHNFTPISYEDVKLIITKRTLE